MKNLTLLAHRYKTVGWILFLPGLALGILSIIGLLHFNSYEVPVFYNSGYLGNDESKGFFMKTDIDILPNLSAVLIIVGGILVGFSREKIEDEYISMLRLKAVFWSLLVSYSFILLLFITIFGVLFYSIMILILFLPLLLYIFRFNYLILKK